MIELQWLMHVHAHIEHAWGTFVWVFSSNINSPFSEPITQSNLMTKAIFIFIKFIYMLFYYHYYIWYLSDRVMSLHNNGAHGRSHTHDMQVARVTTRLGQFWASRDTCSHRLWSLLLTSCYCPCTCLWELTSKQNKTNWVIMAVPALTV